MKFLLDENLHSGVAPFLSKLEHDVRFVPKGLKKGAVFELAVSEERILVTHDNEFTDWVKFPPEKHWGILLIKIPPGRLEEIKQSLSKLLEEKSSKELKGKLFFIFSDRFEEGY